MKKLLIALVLGVLLVLALSTLALADNGPHGGFTATTEKCAGCHRAHSAIGPTYLLVAADIESLCLSCHDGTGAYTNVVDGYYVDTPIATLAAPLGTQGDGGVVLFGGGFSFTRMAHTWNGKDGYDAASTNPLPSAVTSAHSVDGTAGTVWGAGDVSALTTPTHGAPLGLECTSCHDPHGRAGRGSSATSTTFANSAQAGIPTGIPMPSYRLLRFTPEGSNGFQVTTAPTSTYWATGNSQSTAGITVRETANYWYTPNTDEASDPNVQFYRSRFDGTQWTPWSSYVAAVGDLAGRNYVYQRPAATTTTATVTNAAAPGGGIFTCKDGSGNLPPLPTPNGTNWDWQTYACGTVTGTTFNNNTNGLTGGASRTAGRGQIGYWCATCHDRYLANSGSRDNVSGDGYYMYRHNSGNTTPCVDCHVAHGTSAVMTVTNATYPGASLTTGSILMKLDERSICLKCHGHDVNFAYTP